MYCPESLIGIDRNTEATVYIGNLDVKVDENLVWELMVQVGPVSSVHLPKDKVTHRHQGYGFCEFKLEEDAEYSIRIMNMVRMYGKPLRVNRTGGSVTGDRLTTADVVQSGVSQPPANHIDLGCNLFVGNLDPDLVSEKTLMDIFSAFGHVHYCQIARDQITDKSRGFGFISYDNFESSDKALSCMNNQFICNKPAHVSYAYKEGTNGQRHGTAAERLLADEHKTEKESKYLEMRRQMQEATSWYNGFVNK